MSLPKKPLRLAYSNPNRRMEMAPKAPSSPGTASTPLTASEVLTMPLSELAILMLSRAIDLIQRNPKRARVVAAALDDIVRELENETA
jgi:hypothetical protein